MPRARFVCIMLSFFGTREKINRKIVTSCGTRKNINHPLMNAVRKKPAFRNKHTTQSLCGARGTWWKRCSFAIILSYFTCTHTCLEATFTRNFFSRPRAQNFVRLRSLSPFLLLCVHANTCYNICVRPYQASCVHNMVSYVFGHILYAQLVCDDGFFLALRKLHRRNEATS